MNFIESVGEAHFYIFFRFSVFRTSHFYRESVGVNQHSQFLERKKLNWAGLAECAELLGRKMEGAVTGQDHRHLEIVTFARPRRWISLSEFGGLSGRREMMTRIVNFTMWISRKGDRALVVWHASWPTWRWGGGFNRSAHSAVPGQRARQLFENVENSSKFV